MKKFSDYVESKDTEINEDLAKLARKTALAGTALAASAGVGKAGYGIFKGIKHSIQNISTQNANTISATSGVIVAKNHEPELVTFQSAGKIQVPLFHPASWSFDVKIKLPNDEYQTSFDVDKNTFNKYKEGDTIQLNNGQIVP